MNFYNLYTSASHMHCWTHYLPALCQNLLHTTINLAEHRDHYYIQFLFNWGTFGTAGAGPFTGRKPFLMPNQQSQCTEGLTWNKLDAWQRPPWWPPVGYACCPLANATDLLTPVLWTMAGEWVRTLVLFIAVCGPTYTELSLSGIRSLQHSIFV